MDSRESRFVEAYGVVISVASSLAKFVIEKEYAGADGKLGLEDIGAMVSQLLPLLTSFDDMKVLVEDAELFLVPELKPALQAAFEKSFDLKNETTELVVEEIHDVVLSVVKLIVKLATLKKSS